MKIGEIERITGISTGTVRYWEGRGLIRADRSDNRYREYSDEDITLLRKIKELRELGIAIADIKLWRDGVVDEKSLLRTHRARMDSDDRESRRLRELCDRMLESGLGKAQENSFCPFSERESDSDSTEALLLGVDIGTTSISAQLIRASDGVPIHTYNIDHNAALTANRENPPTPDSNRNEMYAPDAFCADASLLCELAVGLIRSVLGAYPSVAAIGVAGQMHGIAALDSEGGIISPLYTWQNQFGLRELGGETICERISRISGKSVPTGYGLVTLYALKVLGLLPESTAKVACISDIAVMRLCGESKPVCHPTNAASLGFYDIRENRFDTDSLKVLGISSELLPEIAPDLKVCGYYKGIPVCASVGDNQAGVFGSLRHKDYALLNIGTSGQISRIGEYTEIGESEAGAYELRPYFGGGYLHSGSVLCGGRALAMLASLVGEIARELGANPTKNQIYELLNRAASSGQGRLEVSTAFAGTRNNPTERGYIRGIGADNLTLSELSDGFMSGIIGELYTLWKKLSDAPPSGLVVSGNALRRNPALRDCASEVFGCAAMLPAHTEEAAFGAALYAGVCAGVLTLDGSRELIGYATSK